MHIEKYIGIYSIKYIYNMKIYFVANLIKLIWCFGCCHILIHLVKLKDVRLKTKQKIQLFWNGGSISEVGINKVNCYKRAGYRQKSQTTFLYNLHSKSLPNKYSIALVTNASSVHKYKIFWIFQYGLHTD